MLIELNIDKIKGELKKKGKNKLWLAKKAHRYSAGNRPERFDLLIYLFAPCLRNIPVNAVTPV